MLLAHAVGMLLATGGVSVVLASVDLVPSGGPLVSVAGDIVALLIGAVALGVLVLISAVALGVGTRVSAAVAVRVVVVVSVVVGGSIVAVPVVVGRSTVAVPVVVGRSTVAVPVVVGRSTVAVGPNPLLVPTRLVAPDALVAATGLGVPLKTVVVLRLLLGATTAWLRIGAGIPRRGTVVSSRVVSLPRVVAELGPSPVRGGTVALVCRACCPVTVGGTIPVNRVSNLDARQSFDSRRSSHFVSPPRDRPIPGRLPG